MLQKPQNKLKISGTRTPTHGMSSTSRILRAISPGFSRVFNDGYAMLISPNKGETAVYGCHCPGDMAVRMREVLALPWAVGYIFKTAFVRVQQYKKHVYYFLVFHVLDDLKKNRFICNNKSTWKDHHISFTSIHFLVREFTYHARITYLHFLSAAKPMRREDSGNETPMLSLKITQL